MIGTSKGRVTRAGSVGIAATLLSIAIGACAPAAEGSLPSEEEILAYYASDRRMDATVVGNVAGCAGHCGSQETASV